MQLSARRHDSSGIDPIWIEDTVKYPLIGIKNGSLLKPPSICNWQKRVSPDVAGTGTSRSLDVIQVRSVLVIWP
jgi:hypothetical protein